MSKIIKNILYRKVQHVWSSLGHFFQLRGKKIAPKNKKNYHTPFINEKSQENEQYFYTETTKCEV